ncbi:hypothetical protein SNE35_30415 [Paucibacter sp. R3-3]|uniref:Uncharacterized protein n=1 Tax=Roseateles agri TaxID=3098619 RepID=A0ABU5DRA4_9BURK|nr:hypothetical protein [Paucibacter sp. R3-3]
MLEQRYQKTEAGRAEIKARSLTALSRSGRNLLLVMDGSRSAREWLAMVQGATAGDVELLLSQGLIGSLSAAVPAPAPVAAAAAAVVAPAPAPAAVGYAELYAYLTGNAKPFFGLIKGYRIVLDVERCADLPALQVLAERFALGVEREHGAMKAREVRQSLGLPL